MICQDDVIFLILIILHKIANASCFPVSRTDMEVLTRWLLEAWEHAVSYPGQLSRVDPGDHEGAGARQVADPVSVSAGREGRGGPLYKT